MKKKRKVQEKMYSPFLAKKHHKSVPAEESRYTAEELNAISRLVEKEKKYAKVFKSGKEFSAYIKKLSK